VARSGSRYQCCTSRDLTGRRSMPPASGPVRRVSVTVGDKRGVSDPVCHAPVEPERGHFSGSLTPHSRVSSVRLHSASSMSGTDRSAA
jgi:hypothetical protein